MAKKGFNAERSFAINEICCSEGSVISVKPEVTTSTGSAPSKGPLAYPSKVAPLSALLIIACGTKGGIKKSFGLSFAQYASVPFRQSNAAPHDYPDKNRLLVVGAYDCPQFVRAEGTLLLFRAH